MSVDQQLIKQETIEHIFILLFNVTKLCSSFTNVRTERSRLSNHKQYKYDDGVN